jgi:hypothetical protein
MDKTYQIFLNHMFYIQPVRLASGCWLVLICSERKILLVGCWFVLKEKSAGWWLISQTNGASKRCGGAVILIHTSIWPIPIFGYRQVNYTTRAHVASASPLCSASSLSCVGKLARMLARPT